MGHTARWGEGEGGCMCVQVCGEENTLEDEARPREDLMIRVRGQILAPASHQHLQGGQA